MNGTVKFSASESKRFGLSIGRGGYKVLNEKSLLHDIVLNRFDLVRIKVDVGDTMWVHKLEKLGIPWYPAGTVINYEQSAERIYKYDFDDPDVNHVDFDGSEAHIQALKSMIFKACQDDPIGFYKTPFISSLISKQDELDYLVEFFSVYTKSDDRQMVMLESDGRYVGFLSCDLYHDHFGCTMAGVDPSWRNRGLFMDLIRAGHNITFERNLTKILVGARIDNLSSQKAFEKFKFNKIGADNIIHILPFLAIQRGHNQFTIERPGDSLAFRQTLDSKVKELAEQFVASPTVLWSKEASVKQIDYQLPATIALCIPITQGAMQIAIIKVLQHEQLTKVVYVALGSAPD